MKRITLLLCLLFTSITFAQEELTLDYYLPQEFTYDPAIPKPADVIGHEVGEWHVTHDKLMFYMQTLAEASDRITIENRGTTFEGRPILLLTVTSPQNHNNLETIRQQHLALSETAGTSTSVDNMPIVVYQGFSVHGNEPSGANAGLAYAYYLAAAQGPQIDAMLNNTVILMDPSYNPDGLQRFAYWANTNRSMNLNPDGNDREYHEVWPGGRTNHYWFDINRDWLPVQLPESRARITTFHRWLPNILTDHHEMGTNSTFFFQPGEPSRVHPLTPKMNQELTAEIGTYHAKALDKIGSLYYSEENYDDYYYGKGSTFPDVVGSIGILFEQASSRGHIQESENGLLTFPFTIRNQFTTALSTVEAAQNMRTKLLNYQRDFYKDLRVEAGRSKTKGFIFGDAKDAAKTWHMAEILERQNIKFHEVSRDITLGGKQYKKGSSYVVPLEQKNHRLIKAMFEKRTTFTDSLFYDISAWTFPLSFNLDYAELTSLSNAGPEIPQLEALTGSVSNESSYAYLFEWHEYYTPKALNMILEKGLRAKIAQYPFSMGGVNYDYGTVMIPVQNQELNKG
ncbi:MAG: zinc carboxypeptidase, partial [Muriicola sp.]|nr:zinc carboxypeptidase [Muriicola sp.]